MLDTKEVEEEEELQLTEEDNDKGDGEDGERHNRGEGEVEGVSPEEEERVVNKVTLYLLPFLSVLYLLCFLDRANLGNAHTEYVLNFFFFYFYTKFLDLKNSFVHILYLLFFSTNYMVSVIQILYIFIPSKFLSYKFLYTILNIL
jgi:hypothetical protein